MDRAAKCINDFFHEKNRRRVKQTAVEYTAVVNFYFFVLLKG